jgi:hypothetical protein
MGDIEGRGKKLLLKVKLFAHSIRIGFIKPFTRNIVSSKFERQKLPWQRRKID